MAYTTQELLAARKLTRAVADLLRGQLREHLATLGPLLRPRTVLGDYVQIGAKETVKGQERAFEELQNIYRSLAGVKPFNVPRELKPPLEILSTTPEISATEYVHLAKTERDSKTITVTSPLKWVVHYSGFTPRRLQELVAQQISLAGAELQQAVLHYLTMHIVAVRQRGVSQILEGLRFQVNSAAVPELAGLPFTYVSSCISTIRPPDDVLIESTEISGMPVFEEVVNIEDIEKMRDPLRERLMEVVKSQGEVPGSKLGQNPKGL